MSKPSGKDARPGSIELAPELGVGGSPGAGAWMVLLAAFLGWMFDGVELGIFPLTARPALSEMLAGRSPAELHHSLGVWMGLIGCVGLLGAAAGGVLFGWIADRFGRVRALAWAVAAYSLFSGCCAFARSPGQLAVMRFIGSLGMGGEWAVGTALVMEVWPTRWRPALAAAIGTSANVGFLLIALLGLELVRLLPQVQAGLRAVGLPERASHYILANSGWRALYLMAAAPAVLTLFVRLFVPESPRWRHAAAAAPPARIADIFAPGQARRTILGTILSGVPLLATWGAVQWIGSWADKLAAARGAAASAEARSSAQLATAIGAVVVCMAITPLLRWAPRRIGYFTLMLLSMAACAVLFRGGFRYGPAFLAWSAIVGGLSAGVYAWLPLYLPELFPTRIRATGQGFAYNFGRVIAAGGTLGAGQLLGYFNEDYARMGAWMSLIYGVGLVVIWFCPETKGKPLPA